MVLRAAIQVILRTRTRGAARTMRTAGPRAIQAVKAAIITTTINPVIRSMKKDPRGSFFFALCTLAYIRCRVTLLYFPKSATFLRGNIMGKIPTEMKCSAALLRYRQLLNTIQRQDGGIPKPIFPKPILPEGRVKILKQV